VETSQEGTGQVGTSQVGTSQVGTGSLSGNGLVGTRPGGPARAPSRRHPRQSQTCRRRLQWRVARHDARHAYHEDPMRNVRRDERYTACAIHRMHHTCQHAAWALVVAGRALVRRQRQHEERSSGVRRRAASCARGWIRGNEPMYAIQGGWSCMTRAMRGLSPALANARPICGDRKRRSASSRDRTCQGRAPLRHDATCPFAHLPRF
jgi:hypothetical protein